MIKRGKFFLLIIALFFFINFISAESINNSLHLNIQTTNESGSVVTGTFKFEFNITSDSGCANVLYNNFTNLTTDSRGIISYYLENVNLNFSDQYWLCYYRDGSLVNSSMIVRSPYTFRAKNVSAEGIINDSNLDLTGQNITSNGIIIDNVMNKTSANITFWSNFFPLWDNLLDLGSTSFRWKDLFLGGQVYSNGTGDNYFLGNVGIGTSNPSAELEVSGNSIFDGNFVLKDIFSVNAFSFDHNTGDISMTNDLSIGGIITSDLEIAKGSGKNELNVSGVLYVNSTSGRVGIGYSNPSYNLDVNGNGRVNGNFLCEGLTSSSIHTTGNAVVDGSITSNMTKISAYKSDGAGSQSINDITLTKITFDTENFDTLGEFSNSLFNCTQAGYYEVYAQVRGQELGILHRWVLFIYKNGANVAQNYYISPGAGGSSDSLVIKKMFYLNVNDYIEIKVYQENGNARVILSGDEDTYVEIRRVG